MTERVSPLTITPEQFLKAMATVVEERGVDWTYPPINRMSIKLGWRDKFNHSCQYSLPDGSPACIIGAVLHELGFKVPKNGIVIRAKEALLNAGIQTQEIFIIADAAQASQDARESWGDVYRSAERALHKVR